MSGIFDMPRGPDREGGDWSAEPTEVRGCDLFEFADGKSSRKDPFWSVRQSRVLKPGRWVGRGSR